ncbi:MAG: iron-containing alcohol dehydrogenase [Treponema sp.]|nr:iron-containing alcohol dehydrogenase [Treponema sp.]
MNIFRKAYCRTFQTIFRIAIPVLPYRDPVIIDSFADLPAVLNQKGKKRPLIVTDAGIVKFGIIKPLIENLEKSAISYSIYDKTNPNPSVLNVEEARELYLKDGCDCLIAVGGGSPMDCAKALGGRIARPRRNVTKMKGLFKIFKPIPLLIAVPTTAGTGSETTLASVITDTETHYKYVINDFFLIPSYAVLDPVTTYSLPPHLTATTGMDAMTHAVEAFIGRSTTKETRKNAIEAVKLIFENLETAVKEGNNENARRNMLRASHLAGKAFTVSYVGYVHCVAHSLGGQYMTPHGLANSVLLPYVLEAYGDVINKKLAKLAEAANIVDSGDDEKTKARKFITAIQELNKRIGIPTKIEGIKEEDLDVMATKADKEGNPLYPVPVLMNKEELKELYRLVM